MGSRPVFLTLKACCCVNYEPGYAVIAVIFGGLAPASGGSGNVRLLYGRLPSTLVLPLPLSGYNESLIAVWPEEGQT